LRILICDADSRPALAATRSLGSAGHTIFTVGDRQPSLSGKSKYSSGHVTCPSPVSQPDRFVAAVASVAASKNIEVLLPMTEITTLLLADARTSLPASCAFPFADTTSIKAASDKAAVMAMARDLDVPIPATVICADSSEVAAATRQLQYPVVIKPARSRVRTTEGWISNRVQYAIDRSDLMARVDRLPVAAFPILLQERICGSGIGFFACYDRGAPIAFFAHRRIREKPATGGVSVLCESIEVPDTARNHGCRLLDHLAWHGVAMIEFKEDSRDGALRLMEINARFWGSLQLAICAGVDFPRILLDVAIGAPRAPFPTYRSGVRSRWLLGDLDSLMGALFAPRANPETAVKPSSRWRILRDFIATCGRDMDHDVMSSDDPGPGLLELRRWLFQG
jgi:predicted ATP-grasp superfamily ATP-dependent carboligase